LGSVNAQCLVPVVIATVPVRQELDRGLNKREVNGHDLLVCAQFDTPFQNILLKGFLVGPRLGPTRQLAFGTILTSLTSGVDDCRYVILIYKPLKLRKGDQCLVAGGREIAVALVSRATLRYIRAIQHKRLKVREHLF
jgi:hypothetical protein